MKLFKLLFWIILIIHFGIISGCKSNSSSQKERDSIIIIEKPNTEFIAFLKKFKPLTLPVEIKTLDINFEAFTKLNNKDNVFIKSQYPDEIYTYGILPDTSEYYKIIWLAPLEYQVPVLTTFTKTGKKISEEYLGVNGCGSDCCFKCKEYIRINKDFTIFSADSIKSCECDSSGPKENTTKKHIRYKTGKILKDGKISMSQILEKPN